MSLPTEVMNLLNDQEAVKLVGTADKKFNPNVIVAGTVAALDADTIIFIDLFLGKTKANLDSTGNVTITVFKPPMEGYQIKGKFTGWVREGPFYKQMAEMIFDQMHMPAKGIAMVSVSEVYSISPSNPGEKLA